MISGPNCKVRKYNDSCSYYGVVFLVYIDIEFVIIMLNPTHIESVYQNIHFENTSYKRFDFADFIPVKWSASSFNFEMRKGHFIHHIFYIFIYIIPN